jgi:hypothetical protein
MHDMANGTLRTVPHANEKNAARGVDLPVQVDDGDLEMLENGTLRVLRVVAKQRLDPTPGIYQTLDVASDSLPIVDVEIDKRGVSAIVTVR